jgi:putative glutamine amidotransferase
MWRSVGTLRLDIPGHNLPAQKSHDVQPLRSDASAAHRFEKVNSSHHQAIDLLADGCVVESWCATDDVIEQFRLRDRPFGLAVQYHPERGSLYEPLFADFLAELTESNPEIPISWHSLTAMPRALRFGPRNLRLRSAPS